MTLFLIAVIAGLAVGSVYGLIAISYAIVFESSGVFNVAQGQLLAAGILMSYFALVVWKLPQWVALLLIVGVIVLLSVIEERIAVRPILKRQNAGGITWFISTLAFGLIVSTLAIAIYGSQPVAPIPSAFGDGALHLGDVVLAPKYIAAFVLLVIVGIGLEAFYRRSLKGTAMRAVAENRDVAALRGIGVHKVGRDAFIIAGVVTGLAAFVVAPIVGADVTVGLAYSLKGFVALAIGGFGSMKGAAIGGLLLGVAEQLFNLYGSSNYEVLAGLLLVTIVLAIRPQGLFNKALAREV